MAITKPVPNTLRQCREEANAFVDTHLVALCKEMVDSDNGTQLTKLSKLVELAKLVKTFTMQNEFLLARGMVHSAAVRRVVKSYETFINKTGM